MTEHPLASSRPDDDPLVMCGRVLAGQTHELTNVLSIVLELSGLLEDHARPHEGTPTGDRLVSVAERLRRQAQRGQTMVKDLNRLAHAVDHDRATVDLAEVTGLAGRLIARFARLKRVELEWITTGSEGYLDTDPYRVLHALIALGEGAVARAEPDSAVAISVGLDGARLVALARVASPDPSTASHRPQVAPPASSCRIDWQADATPATLRMELEPRAGGDP